MAASNLTQEMKKTMYYQGTHIMNTKFILSGMVSGVVSNQKHNANMKFMINCKEFKNSFLKNILFGNIWSETNVFSISTYKF